MDDEVDLTLLLNERELFSGPASRLEAAQALTNLSSNYAFRQVLTQPADNGDATALLAYLNR